MICADSPPVGGGLVDEWVGSSQITKNGINIDLIEIIHICFEDL